MPARSALLLLTLCVACAQPGTDSVAPPVGGAADLAAIDAILDDWNEAWRVSDATLAAAGYADDADFTNAFGFHRRGRAAIEAYLAEVFTFSFVMAGDSTERSREVRWLHPDVALVRTRIAREGQQTATGASLGSRDTTHLRVFARRDGTWRIVSHLISDARATESEIH